MDTPICDEVGRIMDEDVRRIFIQLKHIHKKRIRDGLSPLCFEDLVTLMNSDSQIDPDQMAADLNTRISTRRKVTEPPQNYEKITFEALVEHYSIPHRKRQFLEFLPRLPGNAEVFFPPERSVHEWGPPRTILEDLSTEQRRALCEVAYLYDFEPRSTEKNMSPKVGEDTESTDEEDEGPAALRKLEAQRLSILPRWRNNSSAFDTVACLLLFLDAGRLSYDLLDPEWAHMLSNTSWLWRSFVQFSPLSYAIYDNSRYQQLMNETMQVFAHIAGKDQKDKNRSVEPISQILEEALAGVPQCEFVTRESIGCAYCWQWQPLDTAGHFKKHHILRPSSEHRLRGLQGQEDEEISTKLPANSIELMINGFFQLQGSKNILAKCQDCQVRLKKAYVVQGELPPRLVVECPLLGEIKPDLWCKETFTREPFRLDYFQKPDYRENNGKITYQKTTYRPIAVITTLSTDHFMLHLYKSSNEWLLYDSQNEPSLRKISSDELPLWSADEVECRGMIAVWERQDCFGKLPLSKSKKALFDSRSK